MDETRVLLLHGLGHRRPHDHWLWLLAEQLRAKHIPVQYPQLPSPDAPSLPEWLEVARAELGMLGAGDRIVITHSLGGLLWRHLAPTLAAHEHPSRVLIVSPPTPDVLRDPADRFAMPPGAAPLADVAPTLIVARERDDARTGTVADVAAEWGADFTIVPGHGHINQADGHGAWPPVMDWILDPDSADWVAQP
jgi:uncharacterized protein